MEITMHHEMCPKSDGIIDPLMEINKGKPYWLAHCPLCGINIRIRGVERI